MLGISFLFGLYGSEALVASHQCNDVCDDDVCDDDDDDDDDDDYDDDDDDDDDEDDDDDDDDKRYISDLSTGWAGI